MTADAKSTLPAVFTVDDVARRLGKSRRWVLGYARVNEFGGKAGRDRRFSEADDGLLCWGSHPLW